MKKRKFNCPAEMSLFLFSGKWEVIVLWLLRKGPQRSGKLKSRLPGISSTAFSVAVRGLEDRGLLKRSKRQSETSIEVSYALTDRGASLSPIVKSLVRWGLTHQSDYVDGEFGMAEFYKTNPR